ncbi:MAG: Fur family transcriptional regulator [Chloroflexota bacterium]
MADGAELRIALRTRGLRMTPQRQLVCDVVGAMHGHMSVDQIHHQIVGQFPDVHITTVYRTLDVLEELGNVRHTHFHDGVAQYQRTDEAPHHHMVCTLCHVDTELDLKILQPLAEELRSRYGFDSNLAHTAIIGVCRDCQQIPNGDATVIDAPDAALSRIGR